MSCSQPRRCPARRAGRPIEGIQNRIDKLVLRDGTAAQTAAARCERAKQKRYGQRRVFNIPAQWPPKVAPGLRTRTLKKPKRRGWTSTLSSERRSIEEENAVQKAINSGADGIVIVCD